MVTELSKHVHDFPGADNWSCCFTHTLNLAPKSIICQFDLSKVEATIALDEATKELARLATEIKLEKLTSIGGVNYEEEDNDNNDNTDGWVDEKVLLLDKERDVLNESMESAWLMLMKVHWSSSFSENIS